MLFSQKRENAEGPFKLEQIYLHYNDMVYGVALQMLCNQADAEDAASQVFLLLSRHLDKLAEIESPQTRTYIYRTVVNECSTRLRPKRYYTAAEDVSDLEFMLSDDQTSVENLVISKESLDQMMRVIGKLNDNQRMVFLLKYNDHLSDNEIAEFLGITVNNVAVRLNRAKRKLQEMLLAEQGKEERHESKIK